MTSGRHDDVESLLDRAAEGDSTAADRLLSLHRTRLRSMITLRLDRRISARVDPSDVLQEAFAEAHQKLPVYLGSRPIPFYPWLRRIAWEKIVHVHRQHLMAQARAVTREEHCQDVLPDESVLDLGRRLLAPGASPSQRVLEQELKTRVRAALGQLAPRDREVLVLRFLEQLSLEETAATLEISLDAVKSRQRRALEHFGVLLGDAFSGNPP
jgi:RNA polymerase sigma-70 factor (ECF subfamily)